MDIKTQLSQKKLELLAEKESLKQRGQIIDKDIAAIDTFLQTFESAITTDSVIEEDRFTVVNKEIHFDNENNTFPVDASWNTKVSFILNVDPKLTKKEIYHKVLEFMPSSNKQTVYSGVFNSINSLLKAKKIKVVSRIIDGVKTEAYILS